MHKLVSIFFALLLWASTSVLASDPIAPGSRLKGTFIQPTTMQSRWSREEWGRLFGYFRELGLRQIILQWALSDNAALYPSRTFVSVQNPPVETILQLAEENSMQVYVGLASDTAYWSRIGPSTWPTKSYLSKLRRRSQQVAVELSPIVKRYSSFAGWYISAEVDDINWRDADAQAALIAFLRDLSGFLHRLAPEVEIMTSGFANAGTDPDYLRSLWSAILREAPAISVILFQDGIGAHKLSLDQLQTFLDAVRVAVAANGRRLQVVVETFSQVAGEPINHQPFDATPVSLERLRSQLEVAALYSENTIAFSVPDYMTPMGKPGAAALYEAYRNALDF